MESWFSHLHGLFHFREHLQGPPPPLPRHMLYAYYRECECLGLIVSTVEGNCKVLFYYLAFWELNMRNRLPGSSKTLDDFWKLCISVPWKWWAEVTGEGSVNFSCSHQRYHDSYFANTHAGDSFSTTLSCLVRLKHNRELQWLKVDFGFSGLLCL